MDSIDYVSSPPTLTTPVDSLDYNMCHKYRGLCLILEHDRYDPYNASTKNLAKRDGSNVDSEALTELFTKLGFDVLVERNLTSSAIRNLFIKVAELNHKENDCFVCFVLTHGDHGNLYAYDGRYPIDKIFNYFTGDKCPTLIGKPKLFFIQACQGDKLDPGVMVSLNVDSLDAAHYFKIPSYADFLICYSTLPGFYSFRNTDKGSWFIRALVQVLHDYHLSMDLLSMMTIVCHRVAYYFSSNASTPGFSGMKQVPCVSSMLTRRVFMLPKSIQI